MSALLLSLSLLVGQTRPAEFDAQNLTKKLAAHDAATSGVLGYCVMVNGQAAGTNLNKPFSLQSVMKLVVSLAVLDLVDQGLIKLTDTYTLTPSDLSLSHQPIAEKITAKGYKVSIKELIERAVQESDNCAVDVLIRKNGGIPMVKKFLKSTGIKGLRIDRQERDLQANTVGLTWRPEFVKAEKLEAAEKAVPQKQKDAAWKSYLSDPRDTSTPLAMAQLLAKLSNGTLLSKSSSAYAYEVMKGCKTYSDRLKDGVPKGWQFGHKTGSSQTYKGVAGVTNDVGIAVSPKGKKVILVAFLGLSRQEMTARNAVITKATRIAFTQVKP